MTSKRSFIMGLCAVALAGLWSVGASAQAQEVKQKPPMYTYIANWEIPRAHWPEMAKAADADKAVLDKAVADGTLVGYGNDENLVHTPGEFTHDDWWSYMSMAGLLNVLVVIGGIIPDVDIPKLHEVGVKGVFLPGTPMKDILDFIEANARIRA